MTTYVCPVLVGRDDERAQVRAAVDERRAVLVTGPAGVGKSALVRHAVDTRSVLTGRATPSSTLRPYRAIADALLRARRGGGTIPPALAQLVDPIAAPTELDPLHLADGLAELLAYDDAVLVLEDLHWADPCTIDVLEQLADTGGQAVIATARDDLAALRGVETVRLASLDDTTVHEIASRCLDGALTSRLAGAISRGADGLPFLVEELLAALSTAGRLQQTADGWDVVGADPAVPRSIADTVVPRLARLDDHDRQVVAAAAVIGRRFDWQVAAKAAATDDGSALEALRRAADLQLLDADPDRPTALRFRHALTRDAVDALTFPPQRMQLASRALDALLSEGAPEGDELHTAAALARIAGRDSEAAPLLVAAANEAFDRHAFDVAEQLVDDAAALTATDEPMHLRALHDRLRVLSATGRLPEVEELGQQLLRALPANDAAGQIEVRLRLARAAHECQHTDAALAHIDLARELLVAGEVQQCHPARVDLEEALALGAAGRLGDAVDAAQRSIALTFPDDPRRSQNDFADVEAFALIAWARAVRRSDARQARALLDRAERVLHGMPQPLMLARVDVERSALDLDAGITEPAGLDRAERAARLAGGRTVLARIAVLRGVAALLRLDDDAAVTAAAAADQLATTHRLPVIARDAGLLRACVAAVRGAAGADPDTTAIEPTLAALRELARGAAPDVVPTVPDSDVLLPFSPIWDGGPTAAPWIRAQQARLHSDDRDELTGAAAWFDEHGFTQAAEATRDRLRAKGIPFPRRRAALAAVPASLQARGITTREHEVLLLVAQGLSNREVAERLVLSVRTVDKHVEHLLAKTGSANRTALASFATEPAAT